MGVIREREIDRAIREVDALVMLLESVNASLAAIEDRLKALEDDNRQRSASSGNRGRPRKQLRDG